jgi:outer membrane protein
MKRTFALLSVISTLGLADIVGGELNLGYYNHAPSGTAQYQGDTVDIEQDLKWESQGDIFVKAYLEHPLPVIPNIKVGYSTFGHDGSGSVNSAFEFGGRTFDFNTDIDTTFDLKMYDLTLYYEILDNWVNADIGVNVKYIDGEISVNGTDKITGSLINESTTFQVPIPMLYAKVRLDVPATDLSFQAEGNYVSYDGNTLYDAEIGARYTLALGLGFEAGYKTMKLKINDIDDLSMDSDFSGAYGKLVWDF